MALRIAVAAAAWHVRGVDAFLTPDSREYLQLASSLSSGHGFTNALGQPEIFRAPLYPVLLLVAPPIVRTIALQLLLTVAIVELTFRLARRLLDDERLAAICALIVAVEPTMLLWSVKVMPETLFALCVLAFAYAVIAGRAGWAAAALCAAVYAKPAAYPLVVLAALLLLVRAPRRALVFAAVSIALLAPWHVRNAMRAGYAGFSTLFDRTMYVSVGGALEARAEHRSFAAVRLDRLAQAPPPSSMRSRGWRQLMASPAAYARIHAEGMARTLFDPGAIEYLRMFGAYPETGGALAHAVDRGMAGGTVDFARRNPLAFWASIVLAVVLLPLIVLPLVAALRRPGAAFFVLAAISVYFVVISGGPPGNSRFRATIVPFLAVMSAKLLQCRSSDWRPVSAQRAASS